MTTIAVTNQKGGVGKTTICLHTAGALAEMGKRVLLIDMDQQGSLSSVFVDNLDTLPETLYTLLIGESEFTVDDLTRRTNIEYIYLLATNNKMKNLQGVMADDPDAQYRLLDLLEESNETYDYVLIDCPPSLDIASRMALVAADSVIVPIECSRFATSATGPMLREIQSVQKRANKDLRFLGFVINKFVPDRHVHKNLNQQVREIYKDNVFQMAFHYYAHDEKATSYRMPITHYQTNSLQAQAYRTFVGELMYRLEPGRVIDAIHP